MKDTSVAGIRFSVVDCAVTAGATTKFQGKVTLVAHYNREDLWEAITRRLDGIELHKGGDLQSELITILQGQVEMLEQQVAHQGHIDRERAQRAEQTASIAQADKVRAEQLAELLKTQLEVRARELAVSQEDNKKWSDWYVYHKPLCPLEQG